MSEVLLGEMYSQSSTILKHIRNQMGVKSPRGVCFRILNIRMIVTSVQNVVDFVRDDLRMKIYKTIQDPVTMKEIVACEIYTIKGVIENNNDKGLTIDKKV